MASSEGRSIHWMQCSGAPAATAASRTTCAAATEHSWAAGWNPKTIGLRVFSAMSALKIVVEVGLVTGVTPQTTPTGSAISVMPLSSSRATTPTVFSFCIECVTCSQAKMFLTALSSNTPRPVSAHRRDGERPVLAEGGDRGLLHDVVDLRLGEREKRPQSLLACRHEVVDVRGDGCGRAGPGGATGCSVAAGCPVAAGCAGAAVVSVPRVVSLLSILDVRFAFGAGEAQVSAVVTTDAMAPAPGPGMGRRSRPDGLPAARAPGTSPIPTGAARGPQPSRASSGSSAPPAWMCRRAAA